MKAAIVVAAMLGLAGCDVLKPYSSQIHVCEGELVAKLKSPSSYKRAAVRTSTDATTSVKYLRVEIDYDAANSYNAMLRDTETCYFRMVDGQPEPYPSAAPPTIADIDAAAAARAVDAAVDNALDAAGDAVDEATAQSQSPPPGQEESQERSSPPKLNNDVDAELDADLAAAEEATRRAVDNAIAATDSIVD